MGKCTECRHQVPSAKLVFGSRSSQEAWGDSKATVAKTELGHKQYTQLYLIIQ